MVRPRVGRRDTPGVTAVQLTSLRRNSRCVAAPRVQAYNGGMIGQGFADRYLTDDETCAIVRDGLASLALDGKRVLFIIPDGTRTMPMPRMFALFRELLAGRARAVDYLIALGTHQPMDDAALSKLVGVPVVGGRVGESRIY